MWVQYKVRSFCILVHNWCITCIKHWVQIPYFLTSDVLVVHSSSSNFSHSIALWTVEGQVRTNENRRNRAIWGHHCAHFDLSTSSGSTNNTRTKWERLVKKLAGYIILSSSFFKNTFRYFIQFLVVRACETWDLGVVILPTVEIALWYARCCHIFITTPSRVVQKTKSQKSLWDRTFSHTSDQMVHKKPKISFLKACLALPQSPWSLCSNFI